MQQIVTRRCPVKAEGQTGTDRILVLYYTATVVFLVLDYAAGFNVRLAFLDSLPMARAAYYGICLACLALMIWRPAWTVLISAFESLVTLSALIISMGVRTMLPTDQVLESGAGYVTVQEILNFIISGGVAYIAWIRGIKHLQGKTGH